MFSYYDRDNSQQLDEAELSDIEHRDHLEKLSLYCSLADMLTFDDNEEDGNISLAEFYHAFSKYQDCLLLSLQFTFNVLLEVFLLTNVMTAESSESKSKSRPRDYNIGSVRKLSTWNGSQAYIQCSPRQVSFITPQHPV